MKIPILHNYPPRLKYGDLVEIDKISVDRDFASGIKVRVVNVWSKPKWLALTFFLNYRDLNPAPPTG